MKRWFVCVLTCGLLSLGIIGISAYSSVGAQENGKAVSKAEKGDAPKKSARSGDRLPANYAKIGVSEEQRKKIYEIQNKYEEQIESLQKQITDLKSKQTAEVEGVLTPEQKKSLQSANEESRKKAADKKKAAAEKPKTEESKEKAK